MRNLDNQCINFLQWALPHLRMRWPGFRKVRRQVCKRINRRLRALELTDLEAYRDYLSRHPGEWGFLDSCCRITISRFYRDWAVFEALQNDFLPPLAARAAGSGRPLQVWSLGCASGEESYTISLLFNFVLSASQPSLALEVTATDADPVVLERARQACYRPASLQDLPADWISRAFEKKGDFFCLLPPYRKPVELVCQDVRQEMPPGPFDLILCRYLIATYFDVTLQEELFRQISARLRPGGLLVLGSHEVLPESVTGFTLESPGLHIYRRNET